MAENLTCRTCQKRIVLPAFSHGVCEICGRKLVCSNTPPDKLCHECALKEHRCIVCGKKLEDIS